MSKFIIVWLFLGIVINTNAQTITILDQETNKPLELVSLTSEHKDLYALTDINGQTDISDFKTSERIEIRSFGYKVALKSYAELESERFVVLLEMAILNLEEIVISGTRWRQSSDNVPSKIISISTLDVALQNPQTAADLLGTSGKVYIQKSQQGGGSPIIRGFATNRLLYTVDGIRMNTAIFRGGNIQNVINLDPFATEKTEVLFGPGSVIYGSDAIGGVMSFLTLTPQLSLTEKPLISGKGVLRYSSANNENTGHFDMNIGWKKWSLVSSISAWDYDHLRQGSNGPDDYVKPYHVERIDNADKIITQENPLLQIPTAYSQVNAMQKIRFKPNQNWDLQYGFHYSKTSSYGRYDRHNRIRNNLPRYAEWDYGPQKWSMNNLNISHDGQSEIFDHLSLRMAQQTFEEGRIERSLNSNMRTSNTEKVQAYSVNLDFSKSLSAKNTLFYGFEYVLNDVTSTGILTDITTGSNTLGPARYPNASWSSVAAYLNSEYKVSDKLSVQTGLRYNQFSVNADFRNNLEFYPLPFSNSNLNKGALTGSLGGVYRPSESWVISANLGTGFRAPNVDDIGKIFDSEPGAVTIPNPNLEAEYVYNADVGIAKIIGEGIKVDITAYYTILENAFVRRNFQINGQDSILYDGELSRVQAIQNAAVTKVYGIEASFDVQFSKEFGFSSDINYQVGKEELDEGNISNSRHAVPIFGASRFNYKTRNWNMQFYATYQGGRKFEDLAQEEQSKDEIYAKDENGNNYSPSWYTLNFKAMYNLTKSTTINVGLENITDQRYRPYSSGVSAPGRNFIFSMRYHF